MSTKNLCAIYDFGLFPYALGDVLTWNVLSAIRCEEFNRERIDAYICIDDRFPASIFQQDLVTAENCMQLFNELFGAFGTLPRLANIFVYRRREEMLEKLREYSMQDAVNTKVLIDYERALANRYQELSPLEHLRHALAKRSGHEGLSDYFAEHVSSHQRINAFAAKHNRIPLLCPSAGCDADVKALIADSFANMTIVVIHMRLRRLDAGYGAEHTYWRDSDFLEWYEFLREAHVMRPQVRFVTVGRLQEKPLQLLALPNVISLRNLGLGLGHELSLILRSDLFIGTSSGFAAMANFSNVPYFVTKMNSQSCIAYGISPGSDRLPFSTKRQILVYEPETRELLTDLLFRGLRDAQPR
jgi:hypothetical protein